MNKPKSKPKRHKCHIKVPSENLQANTEEEIKAVSEYLSEVIAKGIEAYNEMYKKKLVLDKFEMERMDGDLVNEHHTLIVYLKRQKKN